MYNLDLCKGLVSIDFLSICHIPMLSSNVLDIWLSQKKNEDWQISVNLTFNQTAT